MVFASILPPEVSGVPGSRCPGAPQRRPCHQLSTAADPGLNSHEKGQERSFRWRQARTPPREGECEQKAGQRRGTGGGLTPGLHAHAGVRGAALHGALTSPPGGAVCKVGRTPRSRKGTPWAEAQDHKLGAFCPHAHPRIPNPLQPRPTGDTSQAASPPQPNPKLGSIPVTAPLAITR